MNPPDSPPVPPSVVPVPPVPPVMPLSAPWKRWKVVLTMVALFLLGMVSGVVLTGGVAGRAFLEGLKFSQWPQNTARQCQRDLKLDKTQMAKIRDICEKHKPEMLRVRNEAIFNFAREMKTVNEEIKTVLTPAQVTRFEEINKRREERFRRQLNLTQPGSGKN